MGAYELNPRFALVEVEHEVFMRTCTQLSRHRDTGAIATSVSRSVQCTWLMVINPPHAIA